MTATCNHVKLELIDADLFAFIFILAKGRISKFAYCEHIFNAGARVLKFPLFTLLCFVS